MTEQNDIDELGLPFSLRDAYRRSRIGRGGLVAATVLGLLAGVAVLAPLLAPHDPNASFEVGAYAEISSTHPLGTDGQGRDVLSRVIWGARTSLLSAVLPAILALPMGLTVGLLAAQVRGATEDVLMRIVDIGLSFPVALLAVALAGVAGGGFWTVVVAVAVALTPFTARVTYSMAQVIRSADFVLVARALGERPWQIMKWELLPNVLPAVIVYITSLLGTIIVVVSGLSFFGLGVAPPTPDWGQMVNEGRVALRTAPAASLAPGVLIVLTAVCFSFVGDAVRRRLDPHE
jgi:ABC-type dipeptide/oligopeptide/nickel transport system permease subunit